MTKSGFYLNKWFLDFIDSKGEVKIFYAAKLSWHGITVHYASCLDYTANKGARTRHHFRNVRMPVLKDKRLTWSDEYLNVKGTWTSEARSLKSRIFDSNDGHLDWSCHQPASSVELTIGDQVIKGQGYAEQLILTAPPWKIPMTDLRWGRFRSLNNTLVWIELRHQDKKQWLWLNEKRAAPCEIHDERLWSEELNFSLKLDREVVLESEKKIFDVVEKLLRYLPGFKKVIPFHFLFADGYKWLSRGKFEKQGQEAEQGMAIHEWVNFNVAEK